MRVLLVTLFILFSLASVWAENSQYLLGDGDVVKITVYDHADLETTVRINSNGTFLFPLIGEVDVEGITVTQVSERLGNQLADGYIINPQVTVFVEEFRSKKAIIMGQVEKPGLYELRGSTTLLELISKAGGLKKEAGTTVMIKRKIDEGAGGVVTVDLTKLIEEGDTSLDVAIRDKDNVFISKSGTFFVTGEVGKPDVYNFEAGTTVIKAITMAGGFTAIASKSKVRLIRVTDGEEVLLERVAMHTLILPDDVIVVPESFF